MHVVLQKCLQISSQFHDSFKEKCYLSTGVSESKAYTMMTIRGICLVNDTKDNTNDLFYMF